MKHVHGTSFDYINTRYDLVALREKNLRIYWDISPLKSVIRPHKINFKILFPDYPSENGPPRHILF